MYVASSHFYDKGPKTLHVDWDALRSVRNQVKIEDYDLLQCIGAKIR